MADSQVMATKRECEAALRSLAKRLDGVDPSLRKRHAPDRTVTCRIPDLETTFSGRLTSGALQDIANQPLDDAQIRLTVSSDDLLAVTKGELPFASAWAAGRLKIEASVMDMIRLRGML
jgi:putative sterol carrier protein